MTLLYDWIRWPNDQDDHECERINRYIQTNGLTKNYADGWQRQGILK
jgi:hypothetical protein